MARRQRLKFRVALTFDAEHPDRPGHSPDSADLILAALAARGVLATFFLQGRWVQSNPIVAKAIAGAGHLIGNHSHYHAPGSALTIEGFASDVGQATAEIESATGHEPAPWYRGPWGDSWDNDTLRAALAIQSYDHGMIGWHVAGNDWDASPGEVEARVVAGCRAHGDATIVLLHSWPVATAVALPRIIFRLLAAGATFVRLDELGLEELTNLPGLTA